MDLVIGDKASIQARDRGRQEFEEQALNDLVKHVADDITCPACTYEDPACEGPRPECVDPDKGIITWECSQNACPCCSQDQDIDPFKTDMKGKIL